MVPKTIRFAYRMTHIANIPNILRVGIVHSSSQSADPSYVPIGDVTAIRTRMTKHLSNGSCLGDFIPFYLGPRTPMLYVIQNGFLGVPKQSPADIVYCVISIDDIIRDDIDCVFTDGHALNHLTKVYQNFDLVNLNDYVKAEDVYLEYWDADSDSKRKKEAELLLNNDLPASYIRFFLVYCEEAKQSLIEMGIEAAKIR